MLRVGQPEIDAIAKVIESRKLFRYGERSECSRFEKRYGEFLGVRYVHLCSSGTTALTAALGGLGVGPGDEVIVPAHTFMATAIAVLAAGAIPVIVDIDESITLSPEALDEAVGPCTRAVIPVHMWGLVCDMSAIMRIARKRKLFVVEDACQCVGGAYEGKKVGSIGHAGAFSFNYYKNMTCGEGGAVVTSNRRVSQRARCMIDCCGFFWTGRKGDPTPFAHEGARASELEGAMLNAQLRRISGLIRATRSQKRRVLKATANTGLVPARANSLGYECGTHNVFLLPTAAQADRFAEQMNCTIAGRTGRHTYTEWQQILSRQGAPHPGLNPYNLPQNRRCRQSYSKTMCQRSLDILNRTVMIGNHPDRTPEEVNELIRKIRSTAANVLKTA